MAVAKSEGAIAGSKYPGAKEVCFASEANELFFGVVGHVGSGTGFISTKLKESIAKRGYEAEIVKASEAIRIWAAKNDLGDEIPPKGGRPLISNTEKMQSLGDDMRRNSEDYAAVAQGVISLVRDQRAEWNGDDAVDGEAVQPDPDCHRAYIIESIRHPAEVNLLRHVYGEAFALIGVVCHEDNRKKRLLEKYFDREDRTKKKTKQLVDDLMTRDSEDKVIKYGQHVAVSAQIRSSCLSRQVGAAIVDQEGNVLAIGSNEVPKAGGGVYGEGNEEFEDRRCFACESPHCSANTEQNDLIEKLLSAFPSLNDEGEHDELLKKIRKVGLGGILEFSRAIHAEMDALTTAARKGVSVKGAWMFVTTFPCHYCARHIVASGIDQVQFIEPYPKSRAFSLHGDSITNRSEKWIAPSEPKQDEANDDSGAEDDLAFRTVGTLEFGRDTNGHKVLFRPFVGVAPRLYHRAFTKDRPLKNDISGKLDFGTPEWGGKWGIRMIPYTDLEARLTTETAQ